MIKETSFKDLVEQVAQDEADSTFPTSQKRKGLRLPGLSGAVAAVSVGAAELGESIRLSDRAIRHYCQETRGVKSIQRAEMIAMILGCSLEDLTTPENLQDYHSPLNSHANRIATSISNGHGTSSHSREEERGSKWWLLFKRLLGLQTSS